MIWLEALAISTPIAIVSFAVGYWMDSLHLWVARGRKNRRR